MADPQISPISQLLNSLGITREDLNKRSDQMRQFLTAQDANSLRVLDHDCMNHLNSSSEPLSNSKTSTFTTALARSVSAASSSSRRDASPPVTPIKSEPHESGVPLRHFDSMEMVLERQRRQNRKEKKSRKDKERDLAIRMAMPHPHSPSPRNASQSSLSLDSFMQSRDDRRVPPSAVDDIARNGTTQLEVRSVPSITPQRSRYYREHTNLGSTSGPQKAKSSPRAESTTPVRSYHQALSQSLPQSVPHHQSFSGFQPPLSQPLSMPQSNDAQPNSSLLPVTPQNQRISILLQHAKSPPSYSPPASSPLSSPTRQVMNTVSSPGPMGPLPLEEEYDGLPYTLPAGPYSADKPDLSYAALVGRAILCSPDHRLTLQEIYDWITIVFPYFKRGETTWMNSIRHVLSTTVCFRKVTRDRTVGRTLWAIWDEDLPCFKDGGFKKHLCKDATNNVATKEKEVAGQKAKSRPRKRAVDVEEGAVAESRNAKKTKKDKVNPGPRANADRATHPPYIASANLIHSHSLPLFPPTRPALHHQPYYESCMPPALPSEIIFPPLPRSSVYRQLSMTTASTSFSSTSTLATDDIGSQHSSASVNAPLEPSPQPLPPMPSSASSSSAFSVPDLTPNCSSSSPPQSLPSTSEVDMDNADKENATKTKTGACIINASLVNSRHDCDMNVNGDVEGDQDVDNLFNNSILSPVQFWEESPENGLEPGINYGNGQVEEEKARKRNTKGKRVQKIQPKKILALPAMPASPTLGRKAVTSKASKAPRASPTAQSRSRLQTVYTGEVPSTPPQHNCRVHVSPIHTPLSHKGLHMSPTASLAHYKSHLDPPPALSFGERQSHATWEEVMDARATHDTTLDPTRTPSRKRNNAPGIFRPVTPKKGVFSMYDSPLRYPLGGLGASPSRTPGSRVIFDPHDPGALLDEELSRIGAAGHGDSPAGLFGRGRGSLLYDSPSASENSPGKWTKWWS